MAALIVVFVCGGLAVGWAGGWFSGWFVDSLPPKVAVQEATEDAEAVRDSILAPLSERMELTSVVDQAEIQEGPQVSTERKVCQSDLRTTGYSVDSSIAFTSADLGLAEALLVADAVIRDSGFTVDDDDDVAAVSAELQQYLDAGGEGSNPPSIGYTDDAGNRITLRYGDLEKELLILINGPCYRHTPDEQSLIDY